MLQQDAADGYVIATGESYTLASFVDTASAQVKLGCRSHANIDPTLFPPSEIAHSTGNPEKAMKGLSWKVGVAFPDLIANLVRAEQAILAPNC
jgi:GDPmannose 4,6-dehydratase